MPQPNSVAFGNLSFILLIRRTDKHPPSAKVIEMATILNPTLDEPTFESDYGTLRFRVTYTVLFGPDELNQNFDDAAKIWEDDSGNVFGGGDDQITAYPIPDTFLASDRVVDREKIIFTTRDAADTELGDEEFKAQIWLRRTGSDGPADAEVFTPTRPSIGV